MALSPADAALFYQLMFSLQAYVCQQLELYPQVDSPESYRQLDQQAKLVVRHELYAQPELITAFVNANPAGFTASELAIVASWQNFVAGDFYIERYLPPDSIWIGATPPAHVYRVSSLAQSLEEKIARVYLPLRVQAVLLPFKAQIIYDGFLNTYPTRLGGPLNATLRDEYIAAKEQGRIIECLPPAA